MRHLGGPGARVTLRRALLRILATTGVAWLAAATAAAAEERGYPVGAGDQLQVFVYGSDNISNALSGRFRVAADGSIYYPLLGKVEVVGKSPTEIAAQLGKSLSPQVPISLPTVAIAEFAPVFLTGDVARTGPFQFQPGMTIFQLVLEAGGLPQADISEAARLALFQELSTLKLDAYSLAVRRARLSAEIENAPFETDAFSDRPSGADDIVPSETSILAVHRRIEDTRRQIAKAQKEGYEQEISFIEKSIALHNQEVALLEEQIGVQEDLTKKGFAAQSGVRDLKRQLSVTRREALEFRTALFRARQNRLAVDQSLAEAESRSDADTAEKLGEVELAIGRNAIALATAQARYTRFGEARGAARNALGRSPQYLLIRVKDGEPRTRVVDGSTALTRGDIVRVILSDSTDSAEAALSPVTPPVQPARQAMRVTE